MSTQYEEKAKFNQILRINCLSKMFLFISSSCSEIPLQYIELEKYEKYTLLFIS